MATSLISENYQLKWHSFGVHLHTSVATLLQSEYYTDTILCTSEGGQIKAHRFILSLCSVYFQNIFKNQLKCLTNLPIYVMLPSEIDYKTLKTLIQYMYCGETTVSNDILENVLKAGDCLKIRGLWRPKTEPDTQPQVQSQQKNVSPSENKQQRTVPVIKKLTASDNNKTKLSSTQQNSIPALIQATTPDRMQVDKIVSTTSNIKLIESKSHDEPPIKSNSMCVKLVANQEELNKPGTSNSKSEHLTSKGGVVEENRIKSSDGIVKIILTRPSQQETDNKNDENKDEKGNHKDDNMKYFVIKEEPIEWEQLQDSEVSENELFQAEMTIKPEIIFPDEEEAEYNITVDDDKEENIYSPLTCELCSQTFTMPADWVRHIEAHSDLHQPAKRQRRGKPTTDENVKLPPLICDLCQQTFPTPAEWVRHIQQTHTEQELALSNDSATNQMRHRQIRACSLKICPICTKRFPSHASMMIHRRTHTGERPFICTLCNKGFNVKSNLLRHLRTLHDKIISSTDVSSEKSQTQAEQSLQSTS